MVNVSAAPPEPRFEPQTIDGAIEIGYGVDVGDVDGDGRPDILLADKKQFAWYRNPGPATSRDREGAGNPPPAWPKFIMAENLTEHDNVCLTARDINGDGKVEVAVGAQWNPGETTDPDKSGAIFYLNRPEDPTQKWEAIRIKPHDPTTHRMRWVRTGDSRYQLLVLPLHGRGNADSQGKEVRVGAYRIASDPRQPWEVLHIPTGLHATHNFDAMEIKNAGTWFATPIIAGKEGLAGMGWVNGQWRLLLPATGHAAGEVRIGTGVAGSLMATIEPMHGNTVAAYTPGGAEGQRQRIVLDTDLNQGHGLANEDILQLRRSQIVAGWRNPNADGRVGIRMYVPLDEKYETWKTYTIDDNTMACEDLKVADLDGDGRLDIVASGRATKNVIVYWNRTP